jgi:flavin reductase (DIM6/NTAB) family NADH-FMN oxidoreductase RutF
MVATSRAALECVHYRTINLPGVDDAELSPYQVVIGRVVSVYIDDAAIDPDGYVRTEILRPVSRLGYQEYSVIERSFSRPWPAPPA